MYDNIETDLEKIQAQQEQEERDRDKAYRAMLLDIKDAVKTPGGQKLLLYLIELTNVNGNNFSANGRETNYLLGRASVGLDILSLCEEIDPTLYPRMLMERAKEFKNGPDSKQPNNDD